MYICHPKYIPENKLKKSLAVLLIFTIFVNFIGAFLWFRLAQFHNYNVQKDLLSKTQQYEILYLSFQDFKKYKTFGKKEVKIGKKSYDYDKMDTLKTDTVKLYALRDYKEEFLISAFYKIIDRQHGEDAQKNANYYQQYLSGFVFEILSSSPTPTQNFISINKSLTIYRFNISLSDLSLKSPPPKA